MTRRLISTGSTFEIQAGYSRVVVQEPWAFVSGTTGYDYQRMHLPLEFEAQVHQCFRNISLALGEAGFSMKDIVRIHYILPDRDNAGLLFSITGSYLKEIRPAATLLIAGLLQPEMKIEIEVTALRRD